MTTPGKGPITTRELVDDLEQRVGGKRRLYFIGGIVGLIVLVGLIKLFGGGTKALPHPAPRTVLVTKVITKDSPLYLDEIGTCAAFETVQVQSQVSGQITSREFQDGVKPHRCWFMLTSTW